MKICYFLNLFTLLGLSCTSDPAHGLDTEESADTLRTDSVLTTVHGEIAPGLLNKFSEVITLPIESDSSYAYAHLSKDNPVLNGEEVRYLNYTHVASNIYGEDFYPGEFFVLDSLKKTPGYRVNPNSDATNDITVYAGGKAVIDDSTSILFWVLDHAGSEGCGSFGHVILYGSVLRNNRVTSCTVLCQESGSGEPGYSSNEYCVFSMNVNGIAHVGSWYRIEEEDYETGEMIITRESSDNYELRIENGMWVVTVMDV